MQLTKIMLIEQSLKRDPQSTLQGRFSYNMQFRAEAAEDKPWQHELGYTFAVDVPVKDGKAGEKKENRIFECKGNYAVTFGKSTEDGDGKKTLSIGEAASLAWPVIRADINMMLAAAKLTIDPPYTLIYDGSQKNQNKKPETV